MITIRRANGTGTVAKLSGNRRKPYAVKITTECGENGYYKYKYLSYHKTYQEALKALNAYVEDPYSLQSKTVKEIYEEWIDLQQNKADGTLKAYETAYKRLKPLYNKKMSSLDRVTLQNFYDNLDGTRNAAINQMKLIKNLIKYAVKKGIMPVSALNLHKVIDISEKDEGKKTERKVIPADVIEKLWTRTDQETVKQILLYLYTGCRWSELYELQPEHCHPDYIEIVSAKTEAGVRIVPLCDKVKALLPVEPIPSYTPFNAAFKEVLPGHHIHDTRHTFITMLTEAGVDSRIIKSIVGHKGSDITDHYTHISLEAKLEAVNKI